MTATRLRNVKKSRRAHYSKDTDTELSFSSKNVEAFWSGIAEKEYEEANKALESTHKQRFDISVPRISMPHDGKLLNIWSRQGEAIPYIRARFPCCRLVNAEISGIMLDQARKRFPGEIFFETDLQTLPFLDNKFDAILSLEMLEHSPSPQKVLREMARVLKPGGQLILTCPSLVSEVHLWLADRFMNNHGEGPHRFPSIHHVKTMLSAAGFRLAAHRATLFIPEELGGMIYKLNTFFETILQWFPLNELGLRQLYKAYKL